ncbi:MAG: hypothetical protein WB760_25155 [Xanthobacteraceae bacterium]
MSGSLIDLIPSEAKSKVTVWAGGGFALAVLAIIAIVAGWPARDVEGEKVASVCKPALEKIFSEQLPWVEDNDHHPISMRPYTKLDRLEVSGESAFCSLGARAVDRPLPASGSWYWRAVSFATLQKSGDRWQITNSHLCLPGDATDDLCDQQQITTIVCDVNVDCPGVTTE